ncbi:MAG: protein kinase [Candidatus Promineifilaceae bacterium]|nr:protein kinase [Candidatus Promineifilaceae bacterium]
MIGTRLGQYEITEEVGQGGMAAVYRAYHSSMQRYVAIKIIRRSILGDRTIRERFTREARLIARLEHPHLLPVHDFAADHDPPYIVMRFLEGGTLKQVIEAGGMPQGEMLYMLRQIGSALDYAHRRSVVHRDLKPSNIMVDTEGNAFVADFGIARVVDPSVEQLTVTGAVVGTPAYMAPEQIQDQENIDHRADLYALGVIVYEMLSGQHPFERESPIKILMAHLSERAPDIRAVKPTLPEGIGGVMQRALAKEPEQRFQTAEALVNAVSEALRINAQRPEQVRQTTMNLAAGQLAAKVVGSDEGDASATVNREQQRQLTALYLDVTDWAEVLYAELDEQAQVKPRMEALWTNFKAIAEQYGGQIQSRTDEVGVALWGLAATSEFDPEQAVRAALQMKAASLTDARELWGAAFEPDERNPLPFRAGIATGPALLEWDSDSDTRMASGPTVTLAGRLKNAAPQGEILVSHNTYTHVRGVFTFHTRPAIRVRGRKQPLAVHVAAGVRQRAFRVQARGIEGVETRMIGREGELRILQEALTLTVEDGETQVVTVIGDAGVGKSRLLYEFTKWADFSEDRLWFFEARATQPAQLQPYSLLRTLLSFRFQIADNDPLPLVQEKFVSGAVSFLGSDKETEAHLIGQLMGFDFSDDPGVRQALQSPEVFRTEALANLNALFVRAAEVYPLVIQVEDIHWADDRSLDFLNNLARENQKLPLFFVHLARPSLYERRPAWGEGELYHHRVQLEPLSKLTMRRLVGELLKRVDEIPIELRDLIVGRAEGNPFYAEELVKSLIDDGVIVKQDERWLVDMTNFSQSHIPGTLTSVLQARLDALDSQQRAVLQRASVVGRVFWESAAAHLSEADGVRPRTTISLLEALREREMVLRREGSDFDGMAEFVFRHAILRDVTYASLVPAERRRYHVLVAEWLVGISGERHEEYDHLVAEHYQLADRPAEAASYLRRSGQRLALFGSAVDARTLLEKAVELTNPDIHPKEWLRSTMAATEMSLFDGEFGEVRRRLEGARPVAEKLGHRELTAQLLTHLGRAQNAMGDFSLAEATLRQALTLIAELENTELEMFALRQLGNATSLAERHQEAQEYLERSLRLARAHGDIEAQTQALNSLGLNARRQQRHSVSLGYFDQSIGLARKHGLGRMLLYLLDMKAMTYDALQNWPAMSEVADELLSSAREQNHEHFIHRAYQRRGEAAMYSGDLETAQRYLVQCLDSYWRSNDPIFTLRVIDSLGGLQILKGDRAKGLAWIGMARADARMEAFQRQPSIEALGSAEIFPQMSPAEIEAGLRSGEALKLEALVEEILRSRSHRQ